MNSPVSTRLRSLLSRSLPLVQQHKAVLVERIERSLAAAEGADEPFGQAEVSAMMLVELLLGQARSLVESGVLAPLGDVAAEHRALGITGRHHSRFGDALVPILRDLLGTTVPREIPAAWCDLFWAVLREAQAAEAKVPVAAE